MLAVIRGQPERVEVIRVMGHFGYEIGSDGEVEVRRVMRVCGVRECSGSEGIKDSK